jgi:hypothetical protein
MYLGSYRFTGDPDQLLSAYARVMAGLPDYAVSLLHLCLRQDDGITVLDACPSREDLEAFASGPDFAAWLADAGLPTPDVRPLGEVRTAILGDSATQEQETVGRP